MIDILWTMIYDSTELEENVWENIEENIRSHK